MGPGGAGAARPLVAAARRDARRDRLRRVDRHPGLARPARGQDPDRARRRLPPHQDQGEAGVGCRAGRDGPRALRRDPVDGGRERGLHHRRRPAPLRARPVRAHDDRAAARCDDIRDHAALRQRIATPVCLDESSIGPRRRRGDCARRVASSTSSRGASVGTPSRSACTSARRTASRCGWGMLESVSGAPTTFTASLPNFTLPGDIAASRHYYADLIEPAIESVPTGPCRSPRGRASALPLIGIVSRRPRPRRTR